MIIGHKVVTLLKMKPEYLAIPRPEYFPGDGGNPVSPRFSADQRSQELDFSGTMTQSRREN
jgi:hypothetical protein